MSGWSVTTNSSPRSAPAGCSATSPTPTERSGSPNCTGSPTPPKAPHPSPSATAGPKRSASTSTSKSPCRRPHRPHRGRVRRLANRPEQRPGCDHARPHPRTGQPTQPARPQPPARHPTGQNRPDASRVAMLADGNPASAGEQVITRTNNRTLRMTASDWVKNGDRWTVLKVSRGGGLTVRHRRNGRTVRLPASYVRSRLSWATPPPCTPRKGSPPTPCTGWSPARSPGSSCTPC